MTALVESEPADVRDRIWQHVTDEAWGPYVGDGGNVRFPADLVVEVTAVIGPETANA